jgi:hypothetical protein
MWATIKHSNNEVVGYAMELSDKIKQEAKIKNLYFVKMTLQNSPAYAGGFWDGTKFSEPMEE